MQLAQERLERAGELRDLLEAREAGLARERVQRAIHLLQQLCAFLEPAQIRGVGFALHDGLQALAHFIEHRLPLFGRHQDALWPGEPWLFHSHLSAALNVKLLHPMEVMEAAIEAYRHGHADIAAVEGFVRQIQGWREYVRGVYWLRMPEALEDNALDAHEPLPSWFWTGETDMRCMREVVTSTRRHAYSHHIQRLMVTGNFALLAGIAPRDIERWYLAMYADALEWVEMPNTLGMAVFADGGRMASKPYAASGAYINRMSDFCAACRYDVKQKSGPSACPFNYLYWAFLLRNEGRLRNNPRMAMPYRNLRQWNEEQRAGCLAEAERFVGSLRP